jgi:hypothetical protein
MMCAEQDAWLCESAALQLPALEGGSGANVLPMIHVRDLASVRGAPSPTPCLTPCRVFGAVACAHTRAACCAAAVAGRKLRHRWPLFAHPVHETPSAPHTPTPPQIIAKLCSEQPSQYVLAVDDGSSTLAEVVGAISAGVGPGPVAPMSPTEADSLLLQYDGPVAALQVGWQGAWMGRVCVGGGGGVNGEVPEPASAVRSGSGCQLAHILLSSALAPTPR